MGPLAVTSRGREMTGAVGLGRWRRQVPPWCADLGCHVSESGELLFSMIFFLVGSGDLLVIQASALGCLMQGLKFSRCHIRCYKKCGMRYLNINKKINYKFRQ
jgi:hypothetical protein